MEQFSYNKARYRSLRKAGRCVACGKPTEKSRCSDCMKALEHAVVKSRRKRLRVMENRIKELEAMLNA